MNFAPVERGAPVRRYERGDIDQMFTYHPPEMDQAFNYDLVSNGAKAIASLFNDIVPECGDKERVFTHLREAVAAAKSAIANRGRF